MNQKHRQPFGDQTFERASGGFGLATTFSAIPGIETVTGTAGDDTFAGDAAIKTYDGGAGIDAVSYEDARFGVSASLLLNTGLSGDALGDRYISIEALEGSPFNDILVGSSGDDQLVGGLAGDDWIYGGAGADLLDGGEDNDMLFGELGNDRLVGGDGNDVLDGGDGGDTIDGGNGNDVLTGGFGNDRLSGSNAKDVIDGGFGDDTLDGGSGSDTLVGNLGNDRFVFADLGGTDLVVDFRSGEDRIDLSRIDAVAGGGKDAFHWIGQAEFSHQVGEVRQYSSGLGQFLEADVNGDGAGDLLIQLNTSLVQTDVILG